MSSGFLDSALDQVGLVMDRALARRAPGAEPEEVGRVVSVGSGVAWAEGLGGVKAEELVLLGGRIPGLAMEILENRVGIALLGKGGPATGPRGEGAHAGMEVTRTGRVMDVPVGAELLGRVVDPLGTPLDREGPIHAEDRRPAQREAPAILDRAPVTRPMQTGLKVVDALFPIGRGQRELILGDRQTGKTSMAVDTIINQRGFGVLCVYCSIAQKSSSLAKVVDDLRRSGAMEHTVVVAVEGEDPPGLQYMAPYAATTMAEFFMEQGRDVLIVYDDLTRHARAYRQLSLLLRRPPGREAFPGDIFFIHSRMLERATHLKPELGGGSLTALPIIETEAQNLSAYIPTNLISITDGQLYVSPELFRKGLLPAVDVGLSVSRVGGKAQLPAYRKVAGDLRLSYSQFQELETFARFGTRLDERTRQKLDHGRRVREALKQNEHDLLSPGEQIVMLYAVSEGLLDALPIERMAEAQDRLIAAARERWDLEGEVAQAGRTSPLWDQLREVLEATAKGFRQQGQA